ncbi:MAG: hypothetical protein OQK12_02285 [Motiliproteus sp.]|nr:hypothetical protein [Motiliproteus sp.]MCW9053411.1 hypothetical protein [Motiliproteus sp.]
MKIKTNLTISALLLATFCSQSYAGDFSRYGSIKGDFRYTPSQNTQDQNHKDWINLDSLSTTVKRIPTQNPEWNTGIRLRGLDTKWNAGSNRGWNISPSATYRERPTENLSLNYDKIQKIEVLRGPQSSFGTQLKAPGKTEAASLLLPAVQKIH